MSTKEIQITLLQRLQHCSSGSKSQQQICTRKYIYVERNFIIWKTNPFQKYYFKLITQIPFKYIIIILISTI